ncbi:MAG: metal-dependent hydrolase [Bacteroides sp.]|nr:metal-dependent hydrolase [Bacteroides sp.]MBD5341175.1 metal-dependent hydrolase [Bacteroides sp.]
MNILSILNKMFLASVLMVSTSCDDLEGDNSDYNFSEEQTKLDPARLPDSYRIATYNTHRCSPENFVVNYDNTAKVISLIDADVIALQEIDKNTNRNSKDQMQELADRTGMYPIFLPCVTYTQGQYGIGMLCKNKPLKVLTRDLPGKEKRGMLLAEFDDFIVIGTHLCVSSADNRAWSYDMITQFIKDNYGDYKKPIYLCGDLNDSSLPKEATEHWQTISSSSVTFPGSSKRIDYVLQYKDNNSSYEVLRTFVPAFDEIRLIEVSDHFPVIVDLSKK